MAYGALHNLRAEEHSWSVAGQAIGDPHPSSWVDLAKVLDSLWVLCDHRQQLAFLKLGLLVCEMDMLWQVGGSARSLREAGVPGSCFLQEPLQAHPASRGPSRGLLSLRVPGHEGAHV